MDLDSMTNKARRKAADATDHSVDELVSQFRTVVGDAEELLRLTADYSADGFGAVRAKFEDKLRDAKSALGEVTGVAADRAGRAAHAAEEYVSENPWRALAIVASLGVLIGMLVTRR